MSKIHIILHPGKIYEFMTGTVARDLGIYIGDFQTNEDHWHLLKVLIEPNLVGRSYKAMLENPLYYTNHIKLIESHYPRNERHGTYVTRKEIETLRGHGIKNWLTTQLKYLYA